jgi:hypothetical protein
MAEKYAGKLHLLKEDLKEKWGEVKETGIKTTVSNNVNVSNPITLLKMGGCLSVCLRKSWKRLYSRLKM